LKEGQEGREVEEEYVSSYWLTLRKREGNLKREHKIAVCG
jgi:hypothetical protein